jgi:osmotically-inducible protein OsmY
MGWLKRLFGMEKPEDAQVNPDATLVAEDTSEGVTGEAIPIERMGLSGEFDQSGLAKRVALAFDEDGSFDDIDSLYVAQTGTTVVLKGQVPSQDILDQMVEVARGVSGTGDVNTDQVTVG